MGFLRVVLAVIVGGAVAFGCGTVVWMFLPVAEEGLATMSQVQQDDVAAALKANCGEPGVYMVPAMDRTRMDDTEYREKFTERYKKGAVAMLMVNPHGSDPQDKMFLVRSGCISLGIALVLTLLLTMARLRNYFARLIFVLLAGVFAAAVSWLPSWNWMSLPLKSVLVMSAVIVGTWLLAGFLIAAIAPRPKVKDDSIDVKL